MKIVPDARLLLGVAAWTAAALAIVVWPLLWPLLAGAALALGVLVAWDMWRCLRAAPIGVRRTLPARAYQGCDGEVILALQNPDYRAVEIQVLEDVPVDLAAVEPSFGPVRVSARGTATLSYAIHPTVRGDRALGPVVVQLRSPLGLFRRQVIGAGDDVVTVYPDVTRLLRPEALDPRRVFAAIGVRPSRRRGEGMDFESLREYVTSSATIHAASIGRRARVEDGR